MKPYIPKNPQPIKADKTAREYEKKRATELAKEVKYDPKEFRKPKLSIVGVYMKYIKPILSPVAKYADDKINLYLTESAKESAKIYGWIIGLGLLVIIAIAIGGC